MPRAWASATSVAEVLDGAQARLDRQVVRGVVAVVRRAREDRRQPQARDAQGGDVVEAGARRRAASRRRSRPGGGRRQRGAVGPGEPVDEHLVDHGVAQPVRDRLVVHVDRERCAADAVAPGAGARGPRRRPRRGPSGSGRPSSDQAWSR